MTALRIGVLAARELERIVALREAWKIVGDAFQRGDPHCNDCRYLHEITTRVPEGESTVPKHDTECTLGSTSSAHTPDMCPAYAAHLAAVAEDAEDAQDPPCPECGGKGIRDGMQCTRCDGWGWSTAIEPLEGTTQ